LLQKWQTNHSGRERDVVGKWKTTHMAGAGNQITGCSTQAGLFKSRCFVAAIQL